MMFAGGFVCSQDVMNQHSLSAGGNSYIDVFALIQMIMFS
jgi:hypothetical protein